MDDGRNLRILIADDEPLALDLLRALLAQVAGIEIVGEARNGDEVVDAAARLAPDLVILDIQMPGRNGLQAAFDLGDPRPETVFVTAHPDHAVDAFDLEATDYILKPVRLHRLREAIDRTRRRRLQGAGAARREGADEPAFWAPTRGGMAKVAQSAVRWIEAERDHVRLHVADRSYLVRATMTAIARSIADPDLIRVHRSAFVRVTAVRELVRGRKASRFVLDDGAVVPVAPRYLRLMEERLGMTPRRDDDGSGEWCG